MHKRTCSAGMAILCFWLASGAVAQMSGQPQHASTPAARLTLEQLTAAAKRYFRDTAEFPLLQKMTFAVSDSSGRARPVKNLSVDYVFQGYRKEANTASGKIHGEISMWAVLRGPKMFKAALNSDLWTMIAGDQFFRDTSEFVLEVDENKESGLITATLTRAKPCSPPAIVNNKEMYLPDHLCGASAFQLRDDLVFRKFAFDVLGLPAPVKLDPFGRCNLQRYHAEVEFQQVTLPGDHSPFLIPKQVTATMETDKGKIVITSVYEPKQPSLTKQ